MFLTGRILVDKEGKVKELVKTAKKWHTKKFSKPGKAVNELNKYCLWDNLDNLEDLEKTGSKSFAYYNYLNKILSIYSKYLGFEVFHVQKAFELLSDRNTRKKYLQKEFPDKEFAKVFIKAMQTEKSAFVSDLRKLALHT